MNLEFPVLMCKLRSNHGKPIVSEVAKATPLLTRRERRALLRKVTKEQFKKLSASPKP